MQNPLPLFAVLTMTLSGCILPLHPGASGVLYTNTVLGRHVTSAPIGEAFGKACITSILGLIATGDASIEAARRKGGITRISSVDEEVWSVVLGAYSKQCTIVRGTAERDPAPATPPSSKSASTEPATRSADRSAPAASDRDKPLPVLSMPSDAPGLAERLGLRFEPPPSSSSSASSLSTPGNPSGSEPTKRRHRRRSKDRRSS